MTPPRAFVAEMAKAVTLPGVWAGAAIALVGSTALTVLNATTARSALETGRTDLLASTSAFETAFAAMPLGTVGAVVIGTMVIGSEYTANSPDAGGGRQITSTLVATPQRIRLLSAKALVVALLVLGLAVVTLPATAALAQAIIGDLGTESLAAEDAVGRGVGGALYWTLTGLIALAVTALARSTLIPLLVLVVNNSLVSVSLLLTHVTPLAHWLPDMAGRRLFAGMSTVDGGLDALPGALVMGGWTVALLVVAGAALQRRDA